MICTKEFTIETLGGCLGLDPDAPWTYNVSGTPGQPPAGLVYDVTGYSGSWAFANSGIISPLPVLDWQVFWVGVSPKIAKATLTMTGTVTRISIGATVKVQANVSSVNNSSSLLCPAGATTPVNLSVSSQRACNLLTPNYIYVLFQVPSNNTFSLVGTIEVECFDP